MLERVNMRRRVRDEGPWVVNRFYRGKNCVSLLFGKWNDDIVIQKKEQGIDMMTSGIKAKDFFGIAFKAKGPGALMDSVQRELDRVIKLTLNQAVLVLAEQDQIKNSLEALIDGISDSASHQIVKDFSEIIRY